MWTLKFHPRQPDELMAPYVGVRGSSPLSSTEIATPQVIDLRRVYCAALCEHIAMVQRRSSEPH